ncbi:MAG: metallophosphoesterase [Kiritimatiellia bacterium]
MNLQRRAFLSGGALVAAAAVTPAAASDFTPPKTRAARQPFEGIGSAPFTAAEPCLQAPAETTMGVTWAVSGLAKGVVELADNPEMANARIVKGCGRGLVPIDVAALTVRLEGLAPATTYWYRTITTPFTDYRNIYDAKLGEPVVGRIHSFTTPGAAAKAHFAVMNDTHAQWKSFDLVAKKMKELKPGLIVWNGDATNTTQKKSTAVEIFLDPPVAAKDYAADIPVCFVSGNHDFRGSWIARKEEVVQPRHPAERTGAEWDLKWNFAVRMGDVALIGMDTGEDKPDGHPKWFGLANFGPYRVAQAAWLEKALARPDIAAAKYKVVFCHIPLFAAPDHPDRPHDGVKIDPHDYAYWSRECHDLWSPILVRHGVQLVVCAHKHKYRFDPATADRPWAQIVGGGCELPADVPERFPTVIEGTVENGALTVAVHNLKTGRVQAVHVFNG